jgi:hypothetical protein
MPNTENAEKPQPRVSWPEVREGSIPFDGDIAYVVSSNRLSLAGSRFAARRNEREWSTNGGFKAGDVDVFPGQIVSLGMFIRRKRGEEPTREAMAEGKAELERHIAAREVEEVGKIDATSMRFGLRASEVGREILMGFSMFYEDNVIINPARTVFEPIDDGEPLVLVLPGPGLSVSSAPPLYFPALVPSSYFDGPYRSRVADRAERIASLIASGSVADAGTISRVKEYTPDVMTGRTRKYAFDFPKGIAAKMREEAERAYWQAIVEADLKRRA